jgi:PAS domain S-box-containing protein
MKFLSRPVMSDLFIAMTAVVSAYTAVVLVKLIPQALTLPSSAQLAAANQALQQQIHDRELAEAQIQQLNEELEIRVAERTQELAASMFQVQNLAERMTLATDAAQMGVYDWNLITEKVAWNDYHTRLMGYVSGATEYSYADWERRVHPEDLPIVQAAIKLAMTDRTDYASEYRVVWEDGSIHWIDGFGRFYYDRDGQPIRMTGVIDDITDRKQSQQALQESEARYRSLIEATSQIIWNTNAEGELVIAQPSWGAFTGQSEVEYLGWGWLNAVHPDDRIRTRQLWSEALATCRIYDAEYRLRRHDGEYRHTIVRGVPIVGADGQVREWVGVNTDITDRKQNEIVLRRSEEFNRRILENNNDCIKVLDLEGRLLYINDGGKRLLEIEDFSQYEGARWVQFWNGSEQECAKSAIETAKTGEVAKFEGQSPTTKGTPKWWDVVVIPMLDERGNVDHILSIAHDITDRIQAEAAIRESEDRFRITFEQAAIGVAHVGLAGQWLRVNQKLCEIVGYSEAELLDCTFQDITHPDDLATNLEYASQLIAGEIETYAMEKRYIHKLGKIVWVNLTVSLRRDAAGAPIHFISAVEKIDDRKRAEFALQEQTRELTRIAALVKQRNQELDQFAHIVSHDLKAPLRAIANLSSWIEDDLEGQVTSETQEHLELMRSRVDRMESMINGLLDYAKVGQTEASLSTFSVEDLLAEIIDSIGISLSFTIDLPANLPTITTNRLLLSQVFANLLSNAYKHHDRPDGRIQITAQPQGEIWVFIVADDGPGIAPENQERVFGIFQTLAARDQQENTGIGLSIVKKIVENHGGNIVVESQLGHGTTFRFTWIVE